jgi:nitrate/nitrite-specific signal transduction histidine kinase
MRERAALLSGSIAFLCPPGGGTLVRLIVPLRRDGDGVGSHFSLRT